MTSPQNTDATAIHSSKDVELHVSDLDTSNEDVHGSPPSGHGLKQSWIRLMTYIHWYPKAMPYEEKSLTLKLDLSILIFGCLSFFTKYLDQQSITNAYVRSVEHETRA